MHADVDRTDSHLWSFTGIKSTDRCMVLYRCAGMLWFYNTVLYYWQAICNYLQKSYKPGHEFTFLMLLPFFPIKNLWYSGLALTSAVNPDVCCKFYKNFIIIQSKNTFSNLVPYSAMISYCFFMSDEVTFSLAISRSWALAFSTSLIGPRIVTLSCVEPSCGKRMMTPPFSSMMERISLPLDPMMELWNLWGMSTVISLMLAFK